MSIISGILNSNATTSAAQTQANSASEGIPPGRKRRI